MNSSCQYVAASIYARLRRGGTSGGTDVDTLPLEVWFRLRVKSNQTQL